MAMMDYGAVVIKNGEQINHKLFEDMEESVGWSDEGIWYVDKEMNESSKSWCLFDNYFAYVGDAEFTAGFYKEFVRFSNKNNNECIYESPWNHGKRRKSWCANHFGVDIHIKEIASSVYLASLTYKGDHYRVIYGYGIDHDMSVWDKSKVKYLGKRGAKKVDYALRRYKK